MGYDDVISMLGDFGRYQKRIYFLLCLPAILCAFHKLGNVFLIAEPPSRNLSTKMLPLAALTYLLLLVPTNRAFSCFNFVTLTVFRENFKLVLQRADTVENEPLGTEIVVENQHVPLLQTGCFKNLSKLRYIKVVQCGLEEIEPSAFYNLPKLRTIDLGFNNLKEIINGIFHSLAIVKLSLKANAIETIREHAFYNLTLLESLDLSSNKLHYLSPEMFFRTYQISRLDCSHNDLQQVDEMFFWDIFGSNRDDVSSLIDLSFNNLSTIERDTFKGVFYINSLLLHHNSIKEINSEAFHGLKSGVSLDVRYNKLDGLDDIELLRLAAGKFEDILDDWDQCKLPYELANASYHINDTEMEKWYSFNKTRDKSFHSCLINAPNSTIPQPCDEYIYDLKAYGYTAVIDVRNQWNLTCDKAYLIAIGNSLFMFGVMFGSIAFGELSDRWGRKNTFFLSLVMQVVFGVVASVAPEFWTFTIARAVVGATTSGVFLVAYVIGLEMVGSSKRMIAGTVCQIFFSVGYMLTAVFAIYIPNWRSLQFALTIPGLVFLTYWWLIPESARWLISNNRLEEAKKNIQVAARCNKVQIPDKTLDELLRPSSDSPRKVAGEKQPNILDIFKYPRLRKRSLIIFFDWFANNITYYGLSWNTNNLGGNPYLNFVISGAVEIPAYAFLIFTLNRWGRKNIMSGCMITAGTALLLTMIVPQDLQWLNITLAMIGKLAITASYGAVYVFSTEQFPTVVRNAGLGAGSMCARVGSVTAPYVNIMTHIWKPLPLLIFGALAFIGGLMSLTLPETLNRKLPESFEEGESFGKRTKEAASTLEGVKLETIANNQGNGVESELLKLKPDDV
ncbi:hypothetical protein YQE_00193, partial [Dendroctonus ponderosae]